MNALRFDAVTGWRGGRLLFDQVSFALGSGQALRLAGPNGTGKSSLLRIAAGLLAPAAGRVVREGRIALADEHPALDRDLPLARALGFWARLDGAGDALETAMAAIGIDALAPVPVRMLSTGQRKRATIARVMASGAGIWLLDEPTNGLDADAVARLETVCAAHLGRGGIVVAATHQPLALPECRRFDMPAPRPELDHD